MDAESERRPRPNTSIKLRDEKRKGVRYQANAFIRILQMLLAVRLVFFLFFVLLRRLILLGRFGWLRLLLLSLGVRGVYPLRVRIVLVLPLLNLLRLGLLLFLLNLRVRVAGIVLVLLFLNLLDLLALLALVRTRVLGLLLLFLLGLWIRIAAIVRARSRRPVAVGPGIALIRRTVALVRGTIAWPVRIHLLIGIALICICRPVGLIRSVFPNWRVRRVRVSLR